VIPNQWYPVLDSSKLDRRPIGIRRLGRDLVLWRSADGRVVAQADRCPHKGARLSNGRVINNQIECPYHGFRYNTDGACTAAPCLGSGGRIPDALRLSHLPARDESGWIWVWHGDASARSELPILPQLAAPSAASARISYDRGVHYTRYIESILEFYHVPWVHRGRWYNELDHYAIGGVAKRLFWRSKERYFATTKVANHACTLEGERIDCEFDMVMEGDELGQRFPWRITFVAPCLVYVENRFFRAGQWMTPIDDENTHVMMHWLGFRHLDRFAPATVHRWVNQLTLLMQWLGQDAQDYQIMLSQTPKVSDVGVNGLVAADEMNARYLQLRRRLIADARTRRLALLEHDAAATDRAESRGAA
jgi:phenylpropionate dioxygenase-like ring-hydroxylating dioxygenase large terminal subunit